MAQAASASYRLKQQRMAPLPICTKRTTFLSVSSVQLWEAMDAA